VDLPAAKLCQYRSCKKKREEERHKSSGCELDLGLSLDLCVSSADEPTEQYSPDLPWWNLNFLVGPISTWRSRRFSVASRTILAASDVRTNRFHVQDADLNICCGPGWQGHMAKDASRFCTALRDNHGWCRHLIFEGAKGACLYISQRSDRQTRDWSVTTLHSAAYLTCRVVVNTRHHRAACPLSAVSRRPMHH